MLRESKKHGLLQDLKSFIIQIRCECSLFLLFLGSPVPSSLSFQLLVDTEKANLEIVKTASTGVLEPIYVSDIRAAARHDSPHAPSPRTPVRLSCRGRQPWDRPVSCLYRF